jgi:hypothetical protein
MRADVDATIDEDRDLLGERPRDPLAERLVLQRLES